MNREIKFRAYHNGEMYNVDTMSFLNSELTPLGCYAHHKNNPNLVKENRCESFNGSTKFMQFIGESDKDGVNIFESDILSCKCSVDGKTDIVSVEYGKVTSVGGNTIGFGRRLKKYPDWNLSNFNFELYEYKVIGNVHQNPELIK